MSEAKQVFRTVAEYKAAYYPASHHPDTKATKSPEVVGKAIAAQSLAVIREVVEGGEPTPRLVRLDREGADLMPSMIARRTESVRP